MEISLDAWAIMIAVIGVVVAILNFGKSDVSTLRTEVREDIRELRTGLSELRSKEERLEKVVLLYIPKSDTAAIDALLSEKVQEAGKSGR